MTAKIIDQTFPSWWRAGYLRIVWHGIQRGVLPQISKNRGCYHHAACSCQVTARSQAATVTFHHTVYPIRDPYCTPSDYRTEPNLNISDTSVLRGCCRVTDEDRISNRRLWNTLTTGAPPPAHESHAPQNLQPRLHNLGQWFSTTLKLRPPSKSYKYSGISMFSKFTVYWQAHSKHVDHARILLPFFEEVH